MKKLFTLAAIATALPLIAVESANIVGYKTFTQSSQYTLIGVCFDDVKGTGMTLNDIAPYTDGNGMTKAFADANADNIQVMGTDGNYTTYFLSNGQYGKGGASYDAELDGKWLQKAGVACSDTIPVGGAFWYISQTSSNTVKLVNPLAE